MPPLLRSAFLLAMLFPGAVLAQMAPTDPAKGSLERQQIMAVLRERVRRLSGQTVTFRVDTLRVAGDWAWTVVLPLDATHKPLAGGGIGALLTRHGASQEMGWTIADLLCDAPSCPAPAEQFAKWEVGNELPPAMFAGSALPAAPVVDGYRVPGRDDPERKAILATLRGMLKKESGRDVVFVVNALRVSGTYAWVSVAPHAAHGTDAYEPLSALMGRRADGTWKEIHQLGCDDPDADCWDLPTQVQLWKQEIPALPLAIFPLE